MSRKTINWFKINFILIAALSLSKYFYQALIINPFEIDQEFLALEAWKIIKLHSLTLLGAHTSVGGLFIAPFYTYFIATAMLLSRFHPFTINFFSSLWASFIPISIFWIANKLYSFKVASVSGFLAAVSLSFANILNVPPLVIPLALVSIWSFYFTCTIGDNRHNLLLIFTLLGVSLSLHFTGVYLLLIVIAALLLLKPKIAGRDFVFSLAIVLLFISPLALFELRHQFFLTHNLINFFSETNSIQGSYLNSLLSSWRLFAAASGELINNFGSGNELVGIVITLLIPFAFIRRKKSSPNLLLVLWLVAPMIFNAFYSGNLLPYYFYLSEPLVFILVGLFIAPLLTHRFGWVILVIFIMFNIKLTYSKLSSLDTSLSLQNKMAAFASVIDHAHSNDINLSLTVDFPRRGGFEYLRLYYGFDNEVKPERSTYTILTPLNWHRIKSDLSFGGIGVILPQDYEQN